MDVREVQKNDAEALIHLIKAVEDHSRYMLLEPGERKVSIDQQRNMIRQLDDHSTILVAEKEQDLLRNLMVFGGKAKRNKHSAYIVIGIHSNHRGLGIGRLLFKEMEDWARDRDIHRLELTVVKENIASVSLYKKMGFEIEGTKRNSLLINGRYVDAYYMSRLI
ncbi:GNAT family N-acetyltransferase [Allobacillus sp. GCM10007491]|uniref:GNAT family N-acetyltransferase n=1 Tax=Allobacillus saliphilus TaxID=2912308 RepID=A0A941HSY1_9BACI|nr:GNAT family N-acetyltransferase [Allobacillus saliphilus]MBR7554231.1 GNAT family N-acetyltransferase [Allobacillus saliphilus]